MDALISPQTAIPTTKLLSITASFLLAGYNLSLSDAVLPALKEHKPQFAVQATHTIQLASTRVLPHLTALSTASYAYLAYAIPAQRREWVKAAVCVALTVPWFVGGMGAGVKRVRELVEGPQAMEKAEQNLEGRQLLQRLGRRNWVLVALQLSGGVIGLRAALA